MVCRDDGLAQPGLDVGVALHLVARSELDAAASDIQSALGLSTNGGPPLDATKPAEAPVVKPVG